jgi:hypothetical protein
MFPVNESIVRIANQQRRRKRRSHHLVQKVEELVGEKGEHLPALLAPAAGDHPAQINVQEGGLETEVPSSPNPTSHRPDQSPDPPPWIRAQRRSS